MPYLIERAQRNSTTNQQQQNDIDCHSETHSFKQWTFFCVRTHKPTNIELTIRLNIWFVSCRVESSWVDSNRSHCPHRHIHIRWTSFHTFCEYMWFIMLRVILYVRKFWLILIPISPDLIFFRCCLVVDIRCGLFFSLFITSNGEACVSLLACLLPFGLLFFFHSLFLSCSLFSSSMVTRNHHFL